MLMLTVFSLWHIFNVLLMYFCVCKKALGGEWYIEKFLLNRGYDVQDNNKIQDRQRKGNEHLTLCSC